MHGADQHIDLIALDEAIGVLGGLGRIGFVIHLEVFDLASAELAALLGNVELEAVLDGVAQRGKRAAVGQHEADLELVVGMRAVCGDRQGGGQRGPGQDVVHGLSPCLLWADAGP